MAVKNAGSVWTKRRASSQCRVDIPQEWCREDVLSTIYRAQSMAFVSSEIIPARFRTNGGSRSLRRHPSYDQVSEPLSAGEVVIWVHD
jgi:hypothetical protein